MAQRAGVIRQNVEEDPLEAQGRKDADFLKIETMLFEKLTMAGVSSFSTTALLKMPGAAIEGLFGFLGDKNPLIRQARADRNEVWILDNTAFRSSEPSTWRAEVTACFFQHGRGDIAAAAAAIVDAIGLDGKPGSQEASKKLIERRLKPFVDAIAPARTLPVVVETQEGKPRSYTLGPSNSSGISSQVFEVGAHSQADGSTNRITTDPKYSHLPQASGTTRLAGPEGWGIISDIDDTIKITQVSRIPSSLAELC